MIQSIIKANKKLCLAIFTVIFALQSNNVLGMEVQCMAAPCMATPFYKTTSVLELLAGVGRVPLNYMKQKAKIEALKSGNLDDKKVLIYSLAADLVTLSGDALAAINTSRKYGHVAKLGNKFASSSQTVVPAVLMAETLHSIYQNIEKLWWGKGKEDELENNALEALSNDDDFEVGLGNKTRPQPLTKLQEKLILSVLPKIEILAYIIRGMDSVFAAFYGSEIRELNWLCFVVISSIRSIESLLESESGSTKQIWAYSKIALTATCLIADFAIKTCNDNDRAEVKKCYHESFKFLPVTDGREKGAELEAINQAEECVKQLKDLSRDQSTDTDTAKKILAQAAQAAQAAGKARLERRLRLVTHAPDAGKAAAQAAALRNKAARESAAAQ